MREHRQMHRQWQYRTACSYLIIDASSNVATATLQAKFSKRQPHARWDASENTRHVQGCKYLKHRYITKKHNKGLWYF